EVRVVDARRSVGQPAEASQTQPSNTDGPFAKRPACQGPITATVPLCSAVCARSPKESNLLSLVHPTRLNQVRGDSALDPASQHDRTCARSRSVTDPSPRCVVRLQSV